MPSLARRWHLLWELMDGRILSILSGPLVLSAHIGISAIHIRKPQQEDVLLEL